MIALMFTGAAFAQRGHGKKNPGKKNPNEIATLQSERMKETLSLSDEQFASVRDINSKFAERIAELRNDSTLVREMRHQKMMELRKQKQSEIDAVLTAEQKSKWQTERKNVKHDSRGKRGGKGHAAKDARMDSLSLTEEQSTKMVAAQESLRAKMSAIRKENLSEDQRKTKVKAAREEHEQTLKSVLSEEQFSKWKELKKDRSHKRLRQEHYHRK